MWARPEVGGAGRLRLVGADGVGLGWRVDYDDYGGVDHDDHGRVDHDDRARVDDHDHGGVDHDDHGRVDHDDRARVDDHDDGGGGGGGPGPGAAGRDRLGGAVRRARMGRGGDCQSAGGAHMSDVIVDVVRLWVMPVVACVGVVVLLRMLR